MSGLVEKAYRADGSGWSLRVSPHYGPVRGLSSLDGGARQLWARSVSDLVSGADSPAADSYRLRLATELGYGVLLNDRLLTLYSRTEGLGEESRRFGLGSRMSHRLGAGSVLKLGLEGVHRESLQSEPEHSLWLRLELDYQ